MYAFDGGSATPDSSPSDQELLARLSRKDEAALSALYDRYAPGAMALAVRILGDPSDAEDAIQTVFVRVWREAERYDSTRGSVAAWIMSSVRNASIDKLRRRDAHDRAAQQAASRPIPAAEIVAGGDTRARVRQAIESLPAEQREVIELAYFKGLSQSEIAARIKQPLGTVKTRMRLGMIKLRQTLQTQPQEKK